MSLTDPAFRAIFENAPIGIVVIDKDLKIVDANTAYCQMLGYCKDEIVTLRIPDITHPQDRQRDMEFVPLLLSGRIPHYRAEKRYVGKDGQVVWVNLTGTALLDESGKALYAFGMAENITERKTLRGLLSVCSSCKKVRDENGYWNEVEVYLRHHAAVGVNQDLCPECVRKRSQGSRM